MTKDESWVHSSHALAIQRIGTIFSDDLLDSGRVQCVGLGKDGRGPEETRDRCHFSQASPAPSIMELIFPPFQLSSWLLQLEKIGLPTIWRRHLQYSVKKQYLNPCSSCHSTLGLTVIGTTLESNLERL